jgi:hypothetical protein
MEIPLGLMQSHAWAPLVDLKKSYANNHSPSTPRMRGHASNKENIDGITWQSLASTET